MSTTTVPTRSNPRTIAARAIQLRSAREAAGLSIEEVAVRVIDMWDARQMNGRRQRWQESVDYVARNVSYLERASTGAYERADAWSAAAAVVRAGGTDTRTGRGPRVSLHLWREALAVISDGDDPLAAARKVLTSEALAIADAEREVEKQRRDAAIVHGRDMATLVWNAADDVDFLDRVLVDELKEVPPSHLAFLARALLVELANELRVTFPDRPARELRSVA